MSNKVARAGNFVVFVASRLEKHGKCRPSGGKWWQVAWQFAGIFQIFPLPLYPESPFLGTFRAAWSAKCAQQLPKQPPPPYARKRLARLAIAEYVTMFYRPLSPPTARLLHCHPHRRTHPHPRSLASVTCHSCLSLSKGVGFPTPC